MERLHLSLYQSEYEFFFDVKKLWKMSLANTIAFCIDNVLEEFFLFSGRDDRKLIPITIQKICPIIMKIGYTIYFHREKGVHCLKFYREPPPEALRKHI